MAGYVNLFAQGFGEASPPEQQQPQTPTSAPMLVTTTEVAQPASSAMIVDETASLQSFNSYPSQPASTPPPPTSRAGWNQVPVRSTRRQPAARSGRQTVARPILTATTSAEHDIEINADLPERISSARQLQAHPRPDSGYGGQVQFRSNLCEQYLRALLNKEVTNTWLDAPEIPTANELMDRNEAWTKVGDHGNVVMTGNQLIGPWPDRSAYLEAHYGMLREEAVKPLREAISWVRAYPGMPEDVSAGGGIGIYTKVRITTITFSTHGLGIRVVFSLSRVGKKILWTQSKRLIAGTLVALTPTKDMFQTKCIVATVAARPLDLVEEEPPKLDLFFSRPEDLDLDPTIEYTMIEDRTSFFEAVRHIGVGLQKMHGETFALAGHIVGVNPEVPPPKYIKNQPKLDLTSVFESSADHCYEEVDVLHDFPQNAKTSLDRSQQAALGHVLKRRVALIQGPPGTGKTHVSVMALKLLINNSTPEDPPIVVACQTNHALDQLLRHVAKFEERFIRLGGRSKDTGIVKERTLFAVKQKEKYRPRGYMRNSARNAKEKLEENISALLAPLEYGKDQSNSGFLDLEIYRKANILTERQCRSLEDGDQDWATTAADSTKTPLAQWLGKHLIHNQRVYHTDNLGGIEFEEADLEFEQLKELEGEHVTDANDGESLSGNGLSIFLAFTGSPSLTSDTKIEEYLKGPNLWKVPARFRGAVFNYVQRKAICSINAQVQVLAEKYAETVKRYRYGGFENDAVLLRQQKVVGVTTTGLSKYRALIAAACPRVIMIEEAAETMEAPVTAGCVPTLEHLILVGDHKQLRPQCGVKELEKDPWYLNVSMFERLVNNKLPFKMLKRQRRMIPEIRRLLGPIYKNDIKDHASMRDNEVRPPVPGLGGINSFFYSHSWPDNVDENMSATNVQEADMIVGFYDYLINNGLDVPQITVLTFYNGQRKLILRKLRNHDRLKKSQGAIFKVLTVDSYQGEENDVVLLSLVRSNDQGRIGFLGVENRICVALSRAKRGFYIFGNAELLACESKLWAKVINIMLADETVIEEDRNPAVEPFSRVVWNIPLQCTKHGRKMYIEHHEDWQALAGGCLEPCAETLPCGHPCTLPCHPFAHDRTTCVEPCEKILSCGHKCDHACHDKCRCVRCGNSRMLGEEPNVPMTGSDSSDSHGSTVLKWQEFANGGVKAHDAELNKQQHQRWLQGYLSDQAKLANVVDGASAIDEPPTEPEVTPPPEEKPPVRTAKKVPIEALMPPLIDTENLVPVTAAPSTGRSVVTVIPAHNPAPARKVKASHKNRFSKALPIAAPITTTHPAARPAENVTATSPVGYAGAPSLQQPLTPRTPRSAFVPLQNVPAGASYSEPFELVEDLRQERQQYKAGQPLIEFD